MPITFSCNQTRLSHLSGIEIIEKQNNQSPWPLKVFKKALNNKRIIAKNILKNNKVIAYIFMSQVVDEAELLNISVSQDYQRLGLATQLLNECEKELKLKNIHKLFLEVRKSNSFAINLYKKLNFKQYSIRKKYYSNGEDALLFTKNL
jgi:ribosomal-protein-alanine N-acetyltransferase